MKKHTFPIFDRKVLLQCLPQRMPIVMVDGILAYSPEKLVANFHIPHPYLFVEHGVLTEPGLIEHMAQSVALHTGFAYYIENKQAPVGYLGSINTLQIFELPPVFSTISSEVTIKETFFGVTLVEISAKANGKLIAQAQMKTIIAS